LFALCLFAMNERECGQWWVEEEERNVFEATKHKDETSAKNPFWESSGSSFFLVVDLLCSLTLVCEWTTTISLSLKKLHRLIHRIGHFFWRYQPSCKTLFCTSSLSPFCES
jgi:hypothetical protein